MQLKKMRDILPKLYTSQLNDINNSLTTSPKQTNEDKGNQPKRIEDQNCVYQGTEGEDKLSLVHCIKCRSVQKLPVHAIQKDSTPRKTEDTNFICSSCNQSILPTFHFVADSATSIDLENQEKTSLSKTQKTFKVKNFQPDKYYCDKCRFSTKDPLQYKKHVVQHEEIKFVCSHCNYVSYTKGEFQRHLVKHTGIFPYQCEYCDYGAVRHDYIVKHTRRVHETVTEKGLLNMATKQEQNRSCMRKQSTLFSKKQKCDQKVPPQNEPSDLSSTACSRIEDEMSKTVCLSDNVEGSLSTVSVQDKTLVEPDEENIYENRNVEVEVYSPEKEPVQPGMPLTVIAPSELVVPSNCLAQLLEIKIVNGTQQLVLKLIPLKEKSNKPLNSEEEELRNQSTEQTDKGKGITSVAQSELTTKATVDKLSSVSNMFASDHIYDKNSECLNSSSSHTSDSNSNVPSQDKSRINCPKSSNKEKYTNNDLCYSEETLDMSTCTYAASSEDNRSQTVLLQVTQESNSSSSSYLGEKDIVSLNGDDKETRSQISLETHLFDTCLVKESFKTSLGVQEFSLNKSGSLEEASIGLNKLNRENSDCQNNHLEILELQNVENKDSLPEGPVISSVFSLSSGAENIPEGIKWDNTARNKKSTAMLCRKIAQLMSIAECNVKSTLAGSSMPARCCASSKMPLPQGTLANYETNVPATELEQSASSLQTPHNGGISNELCNKQQPESLSATTKTKSRMSKNTHMATPVFIPKGTVLRVLNVTKSEIPKETGDKNEISGASTCCNEMFLPRPVPFSISEKLSDNLPMPNESELFEQPKYQNISLRQRPKREANAKSNSKQNCVLLHQTSDEPSKQSKLSSKDQLVPKNKIKQSSSRDCLLSKKRTKIHSDTIGVSEATSLLKARRLRLVPFRTHQLIKCPRRNQPVVVLNHPDVDSAEQVMNEAHICSHISTVGNMLERNTDGLRNRSNVCSIQ
nr:zinc finger protein 518B isoform X2 [Pelodiscus sinensis]|eukprot:XP_006128240.1 zinc finger protein 518B isoform X2 [Pelodiscus sinensis]